MSKRAAEAKIELSLVDRITGPIKRIQARISNLSRRMGLDRIGRATSSLTRRIGGLGDALGTTAARLGRVGGLLGLGGAGVIAGMFKLAESTASIGDEAAKTAKTVGLTAEQLQELRYAAERSGIQQSKLDSSMLAFTKRLGEAKQGTGQAKDALKELGISMSALKGKTPLQALEMVSERLKDIEDPLERNAILSDLFSRQGIAMGRMLMDGAGALRDLRKEARETGNVIGNDAAAAAETFQDNLLDLTQRLKGLRNIIGVNLMPVVDELIQNLTGWIDANRQLIRQKIGDWTKRLAGVLRDLMDPASDIRQRISEMASSASDFLDRLRPLVDFLGGPLKAGMVALAAYITGPLVLAFAALGGAFVNLGIVIMTTPIGWIIAGLAALGAVVYVLYQKWDEFVAYWGGLWDRITAAFDEGWTQGILTAFLEFQPLTHIIRGFDAVLEYFTGFSLLDQARGVVDSFMDGLKGLDVAGWFREKFDAAVEYLKSLSGVFYSLGADIVSGIWDGLKSQWAALKDWLSGALRDLIPDWTPDWLRNKLGFGGAGADSGGEGSRPVIKAPSIETPTVEPAKPVRFDPFTGPIKAPSANVSAPTVTPGRDAVKTKEVDAGTVTAKTAEFAEPIIAHEPQHIDASTHIESLIIQGGQGSPADIRAAVDSALAAHSRRREAEEKSSLSD